MRRSRILAPGLLALIAAPLLGGCRSTYQVDFVPVDTRLLSAVDDDERKPADRPEEKVRIAWAIRGWSDFEAEKPGDRGPEILVGITCRNGMNETFVLLQDRMRIIDDEGRELAPRLTEADRGAQLAVPAGGAVTFKIPFRSEERLRLERIGSIRVRWTYRVGAIERDLETKFFRESLAPRSSSPTFGLYFGSVFYGP